MEWHPPKLANPAPVKLACMFNKSLRSHWFLNSSANFETVYELALYKCSELIDYSDYAN